LRRAIVKLLSLQYGPAEHEIPDSPKGLGERTAPTDHIHQIWPKPALGSKRLTAGNNALGALLTMPMGNLYTC
jgi:hypothetical protein